MNIALEPVTPITKPFVEQYFGAKAVAGTITTRELADAELLKMKFVIIAEWTGDGTAWTFPCEVVPQ